MIYKVKPCEEPKCFKGFECPFYHSSKDKRVIKPSEPHELDKLFIPVERLLKSACQPKLIELYFDNNLNHIKEQSIAHPEFAAQHEDKENRRR